jgi:hypothetical protein
MSRGLRRKLMRPRDSELLAAIDREVPLIHGRPSIVATHDGRGVAMPDLAHPGAWVGFVEVAPGIVAAWDDDGTSWAVAGMAVNGADCVAVAAAAALSPQGTARHAPGADAARLEAGKAAMGVRDVMVRARLLDAVEGWEAVLGATVDGSIDGPDGLLADSTVDMGNARLLVVTCPSTGRRYVHPVPAAMSTARAARLWLMRLKEAPEVET